MKDIREDFVLKRYNDQLHWYSKKANSCKTIAQMMSVLVVLMSLLLPVATSVLPYDWKFRWMSLTLSFGIGLVTGLDQVFRWRDRWVLYRATEESLKREYSLYVVKAGVYANVDEPIVEFLTRVEAILLNEHSKWILSESSEKCQFNRCQRKIKDE